jgi:hypothetical protein
MRFWLTMLAAGALVMTLGGCFGGPVKRVSEPSASIQQLEVRADGSWNLALRLQNFSTVPMRFERVDLRITAAGQDAGTLVATPSLTVGPESADIATLAFTPSANAKIALANALAEGRSLDYTLEGEVVAAAGDARSRPYRLRRNSALSPVPGMPGVLR